MSNILDFNSAANAETDHEHQVQLDLFEALWLVALDRRFVGCVRNGL